MAPCLTLFSSSPLFYQLHRMSMCRKGNRKMRKITGIDAYCCWRETKPKNILITGRDDISVLNHFLINHISWMSYEIQFSFFIFKGKIVTINIFHLYHHAWVVTDHKERTLTNWKWNIKFAFMFIQIILPTPLIRVFITLMGKKKHANFNLEKLERWESELHESCADRSLPARSNTGNTFGQEKVSSLHVSSFIQPGEKFPWSSKSTGGADCNLTMETQQR